MKIMRKIVTLVVLITLALVVVINFNPTQAATCTLQSVDWSSGRAAAGDSVEFTIVGQNCQTWGVSANIKLSEAGTERTLASIPLHFPADSSTIKSSWTVNLARANLIMENAFFIEATIGGSGVGTTVSSNNTGTTKYLYVKASGAGSGNPVISFDVNPKKIDENSVSSLKFTLGLTVGKPADLKSFCDSALSLPGASFPYIVVIVKAGNKVFRAPGLSAEVVDPNLVKQLDGKTSSYKFDFDQNYKAGSSGTVNFQAGVICSDAGKVIETYRFDQITKSSLVPVTIGTGGTSPGGGGTIPATEDKTYSFEITNPLKGGPNDLFDIINIVTQWIMYISIPLAVLFIMYAGFLMLTAGPFPDHFQKGRDILKFTILGLAIIFIGKGFVSLIISVIQLGGESPPTTQIPNNAGSGGNNADPRVCGPNFTCGNTSNVCRTNADCDGSPKDIGGNCSQKSECMSGLSCSRSNICIYPNGNREGEPCSAGADCVSGLVCNGPEINVYGREMLTCVQPLCVGGFCRNKPGVSCKNNPLICSE